MLLLKLCECWNKRLGNLWNAIPIALNQVESGLVYLYCSKLWFVQWGWWAEGDYNSMDTGCSGKKNMIV